MRTVWLAIILSILAAPVAAQWLRLPLPGTPRMSDGRPNLSAPTPRTADGRPDLSGIWLSWNWHRDNPDRGRLFLTGIDVPMQPWAEALYRERQGNQSKDDPEGFCLPAGIPEQMVNPLPWKIIQTPGVTVIPVRAMGELSPDLHGRPTVARDLAAKLVRLLDWQMGG
jgi:hypothetical protein